jgi:EpsI family protein
MTAFRVSLSSVVLIGALTLLQFRSTGEAVPIRKSLETFPGVVGGWQGQEATIFDAETLNVLRVKDYLMRRYMSSSGRNLLLYIGYWDTQRKGAQIHSPKNCLPGAGWEPVEASLVIIPASAQHGPITINRYLIQKDNTQQLVLYWYHSQGRAIAGEVAAKIQMVKNGILRNRTDGALVRVSSPIYGSVPETTETLVKYIQALYPLLADYLPD